MIKAIKENLACTIRIAIILLFVILVIGGLYLKFHPMVETSRATVEYLNITPEVNRYGTPISGAFTYTAAFRKEDGTLVPASLDKKNFEELKINQTGTLQGKTTINTTYKFTADPQ